MVKKIFLVILVISVIFIFAEDAFSRVVKVKSVSSGVYEDGVFTETNDKFKAEYSIDEMAGVVNVEKIIHSDREGRIGEDISYEITNMLVSEGLSSLLVSRDKKGQKIVTAVRDTDLGSTEIIMLGEDFYQYCRAANGKLYLEYGKIVK